MYIRSCFYRLFSVLCMAMLAIVLISCAVNKPLNDPTLQIINSDNSGADKKFAIYAMMASNAYQDMRDLRFPLEIIGWNLIFSVSDKSGLAFDIFEHENSNEVVVAYRGTEPSDIGDFRANFTLTSCQPKIAQEALEYYRSKNPDKHITLTGHSLGGGLALGMSLRFGFNAIVFNPSPRLYDGIGHFRPYNEEAERVVIFQEGELLESFRDTLLERIPIFPESDSTKEIVPNNNIYQLHSKNSECNDAICKHSMRLLALKLIKYGQFEDPELKTICKEKEIYCQKK